MGIEGLHEETGPGVMEAAIARRRCPGCGRRGLPVKTFAKVIAQNHGYMATFMAKWNKDGAGPERTHPHVAEERRWRLGLP